MVCDESSILKFQSAPPVKGATHVRPAFGPERVVSIRAPREGGDATADALLIATYGFNPRPP